VFRFLLICIYKRERKEELEGVVRGTTIFGVEDRQFSCFEVSQPMPTRPSGKVLWGEGKALGSEGGKVLGRGLHYD
jgi:hypothetical protein